MPISADLGCGKAPREPRLPGVAGDVAQVDDRGRAVEGPQASPAPGPSAASPARARRRARPDRWLAALLVENRGPECTLIAYIDDATSRIQHAAFVPSESTLDYMRETQAYIERHGRPIAFYSDKHSSFRVNNREAVGGDGMTQFGRALNELNIDIICANTPQAKAEWSVHSGRFRTGL